MKITFGKYRGKVLGDIYESDTKYLEYLIDQARDTSLVNACKYIKTQYGKN